ncbi:sensor histidine kinase [Kytococcus sedentarius]|uniref:sensor histidine kinase n=1 Tax=Kytococcus sedentarius TaxID=1276 RepID=UPI0035BBC4D6
MNPSTRGTTVTGRQPRHWARPGHWPLRVRLLAVVMVLLVGALSATAIALAILMQQYMVRQVDDQLERAAAPVAQSAFDSFTRTGSTGFRPPNNYWIQFMPVNGTQPLTIADAQSAGSIPRIGYLHPDDPRVRSGEPFTVTDGNGDRWRVVAGVDANEVATYAVARPLRDIDEAVQNLQILAFSIGLLALAAGALLGWPLMNRAFRPLTQIEDTAAGIAEGNLSRRVPHPGTRDEVGSLASSLNLMLAHVERSFAVRDASEQQMRRFIADASHELRTPMAAIRGYAELYRSGAITGEENTAAAMRRIEDEATRMGVLVEDLMTLARLDAGQRHSLSPSPGEGPGDAEVTAEVDLTVLASDAVADTRAWAPERTLRLHGLAGQPLEAALVRGDEHALRQVVTNLVANAVRHTSDGPIEVSVGRDRTEVVLRVVDHGPGIPEEDRPRVFERFYRSDPSRQRGEGGGSGLGLAIVATTVEQHEGTVQALGTPGGGATFEVRLPAAEDETA